MTGDRLLRVRLWFQRAALAHLLLVALLTLTIDTSQDPDPAVRVYGQVRWRLITFWFNLITIFYLGASLYVHWAETKDALDTIRLKKYKDFLDCLMTSFVFPFTMLSDTMFWRLWHLDPSLIGPMQVFQYLTMWKQHSLHTVSMLVVVLDILLTPRHRPHGLTVRYGLMVAAFMAYCLIVYTSPYTVYPILERFKPIDVFLLWTELLIELLFFFSVQWCIIDFVWGGSRSFRNQYKTTS